MCSENTKAASDANEAAFVDQRSRFHEALKAASQKS